MFNSHLPSPKKLLEILDGEETPKIDFKQKVNTNKDWMEEMCKDIIAIANGNKETTGQYGYLIFGASDKKNSETGRRDLFKVQDPIDTNKKEFYDKLKSFCNPFPDFERGIVKVEVPNKTGVLITKELLVYAIRPSNKIYHLKKKLQSFGKNEVLVRRVDGEETESADPDLIVILAKERKRPFRIKLITFVVGLILIFSFIYFYSPIEVYPKSAQVLDDLSTTITENRPLIEKNPALLDSSPINVINAKLLSVFDINSPLGRYLYKVEVTLQKNTDKDYWYYGQVRTNWNGEPEYAFFTLSKLYPNYYIKERYEAITNLFYHLFHYFVDRLQKNHEFDTLSSNNIKTSLTATTIKEGTHVIYLYSSQSHNTQENFEFLEFRLLFSTDKTRFYKDWNTTRWYPVDISKVVDNTLLDIKD